MTNLIKEDQMASSRGSTTSEPRQAANDLLARVEAATGPDRALSNAVCIATGVAWTETLNEPGFVGDYMRGWFPDVTASLEAALALAERVLPGEAWGLLQDALFSPRVKCSDVSVDLPLALLAAMLRALGNTASPGSACSGDADTGEGRG